MKIQYRLQGIFSRNLLNGEQVQSISLVELLQAVQTVATQNQRRTPQLLRQSLGLSFLPYSVLIELLKKSNQVRNEEELYQIPELQLLHPRSSQNGLKTANFYHYQFISPEATLTLTPDDPQLPVFNEQNLQQSGSYILTLSYQNYSGLSPEFSQEIWQQAIESWQSIDDSKKIDLFLHSIWTQEACLTVSSTLSVAISLQEIPLSLREAIMFFRQGGNDTSILSESALTLVQNYQRDRRIPIINFPYNLYPNSDFSDAKKFFLGRENRNLITQIINKAQEFLLISSYIIEDETVTELICQKSSQLSQGVWILTDLRDEVIDRIDTQTQVEQQSNLPENYQNADQLKIKCIRQLLETNVQIRSGRFHLKTCISEQYAYLGSCNLTSGSLDRNLEAGMIWRNTPLHSQLIDKFRHFWHYKSRDDVIRSLNLDGFILRSIKHYPPQQIASSPHLLNPRQYYQDLIQELSSFQGSIIIFSRSFQPTQELENLLSLSKTKVIIESQMMPQTSSFKIIPKHHCHAKITLLGNKVAYIGGINFNFSSKKSNFNDLMYKTTNPEEITQIIKTIKAGV